MKKLILSLLIFMQFLILNAQNEKSLLGALSGEYKIEGWFVMPQFRKFYNKNFINQDYTNLVGGKAGIILNKNIYLGVSGYSKVSKNTFTIQNNTYGVSYGYGGIYCGITPYKNKIIHPSIGVTAGYGGALEYLYNTYKGATLNTAGFMYCEPEINLEINFTKWNRIVIGFSYRFVDTSNFNLISKNYLNGYDFHIGMLFGKI